MPTSFFGSAFFGGGYYDPPTEGTFFNGPFFNGGFFGGETPDHRGGHQGGHGRWYNMQRLHRDDEAVLHMIMKFVTRT